MNAKSTLKVKYAEGIIEMNTTFAKMMQNPLSDEYALLQKTRMDFPTFAVRTRQIKSNPKKDTYKGLTYEYMKKYINLFVKMLIDHYANTSSFTSARDRFDYLIEPYLDRFTKDDFVRLIQVINKNNQIYNYSGQRARNNSIIASAKFVLPEDFDYDAYEKFRYTKIEEKPEESNDEAEIDASQVPDNDPELPF